MPSSASSDHDTYARCLFQASTILLHQASHAYLFTCTYQLLSKTSWLVSINF